MPADLFSTLMLILLKAAYSVERAAPYVVGGIVAAALLSRALQHRGWAVPTWLPPPLTAPLAAAMGVVSPLPTTGAVPLVLQLQSEGLSARLGLTFVLASSLLNPQLFMLTLGVLGARFALAQVAGVLVLSIGLGLALGRQNNRWCAVRDRELLAKSEWRASSGTRSLSLAGHIGLYYLTGVIAGACLEVLLPRFHGLNWLSQHGWLSTPVLGWLGAPLYICGGSAVPLADSLAQIGFSPGTLFTFLLVGPALRGTTLANLGCLLSKRAQAACLTALLLAGGLLGYGFDWLVRMT